MPNSKSGGRMVKLFPSWTAINRDENSTGSLFLDVVGTELDHLFDLLDDFLDNATLANVDISQIDIIYKADCFEVSEAAELVVVGSMGSREDELTPAVDLHSFYAASEDSDLYLYDPDTNIIYVRQKYDHITINGTSTYLLVPHHVWGPLDEIGLLVDCPRLYEEKNSDYLSRIKSRITFKKSCSEGSIEQSLDNAMGLPANSVQIESLSNAAFVGSMLDDNGEPTEKLMEYIKKANRNLSETWDTGVWDKSFWTTLESAHMGLEYIPHIWSYSERFDDALFTSGISDGEDLMVSKPSLDADTQTIKYFIGQRGLVLDSLTIYPTRQFRYKLYAVGSTTGSEAKPIDYKYTVIASPKIPLEANITAEAKFEQSIKSEFESNVRDISEYESLTAQEREQSYFTQGSNLECVDGNLMAHPNSRYVRLRVKHISHDEVSSPQLTSITLTYHNASNVEKTLVIEDRADVQTVGNTTRTGFLVNNLGSGHAVNSAGVANNLEVSSNKLGLVKGEYDRNFDTKEEWIQSADHSNIKFTSSGIFLNI